ncbi:MAG TPA: dihydrofolate reductase family protein, partial [Candidatus Dormibacteraeota bacterium]|nr:dihydrofolate reductase family protein [Candidatus Dormibacteraeota bacterium]
MDHEDNLLARHLRIESGTSGRIPEDGPPRFRGRSYPLKPLVCLYEAPNLPTIPLPPGLSEKYGGQLAIPDGAVYANFVSSIDGIAALEGGRAASGGIISGRNQADRFVMALLRAFAEAVVVGAGTVRAEGRAAMWTPGFVFPAAADDFRALRHSLKRAPEPRLVIITARGNLNPSARALLEGALVLTTEVGAAGLKNSLPAST